MYEFAALAVVAVFAFALFVLVKKAAVLGMALLAAGTVLFFVLRDQVGTPFF